MSGLKAYIKPKSVTWWPGALMVASALALTVGEQVPAAAPYAELLRTVWGGMSTAELLAGGLAIIGLRKAVGDVQGS